MDKLNNQLDLLTVEQAAEDKKVERKLLDEWIKEGKIRFYRSHTDAGRGAKAAILIDREDLNEAFNGKG